MINQIIYLSIRKLIWIDVSQKKKMLTRLIIRKIKNKIKMRYCLISFGMTVIKKTEDNKCYQGCKKKRKRNSPSFWWYITTANMVNHMGVPPVTKNRTITSHSCLTTRYWTKQDGISVAEACAHHICCTAVKERTVWMDERISKMWTVTQCNTGQSKIKRKSCHL